MTRLTIFDPNIGDRPANLPLTNNYDATTDPGVGDDSADGYSVGSVWVNTTLDIAYICTDDTEGAAAWSPMTEGGTAPGQIEAPDASTPTGTGGNARIRGGDGGSTSGVGGTSSNVGGAGVAGNSAGGAADTTGGAGQGSAAGGVGKVVGGAGGATGAGGKAQVTGGAGGATSGAGGDAEVTGGAATAGNSNGGNAVRTGGAKQGTGIAGAVIDRSDGAYLKKYPAPAAKTTATTLTPAELIGGMLTANQGGGAAANYTLPLGTDMDTAIPAAAVGDCIDFSLINISTVAAEDITIITNTGFVVSGGGNMVVASNAVATDQSVGQFRARKTGVGTWQLYRVG